jgi:hypothetical protein
MKLYSSLMLLTTLSCKQQQQQQQHTKAVGGKCAREVVTARAVLLALVQSVDASTIEQQEQ